MSEPVLLFDTFLRGMTVGAQVLLALIFWSRRPMTWRRGLGGAFVLGAAAYVIESSDTLCAALGGGSAAVHLAALYGPVAFWWFSLALFDDEFVFHRRFLAPVVALAPTALGLLVGDLHSAAWLGPALVTRTTEILLFAHAIYIALVKLNDDLIGPRRRFRVIFAIAVGVTGLLIQSASIAKERGALWPAWLPPVQAAALLAMTLGFGVWLLGMRGDVLDGAAAVKEAPPSEAPPKPLRAVDRLAYEKLSQLMAAEVWKEEGLTVAMLAARMALPEHQLRALINGALGFKNFSAFLGATRIAAAKAALADPAQARRQILQIALDVGYGSIAPFNRAFKETTGVTPSEFRKAALAPTPVSGLAPNPAHAAEEMREIEKS